MGLKKQNNLKILKKYFKELCLKYYIYNILSFDLILKFSTFNLFKLLKLLKFHQFSIILNITSKITEFKEINNSLFILQELTKQKSYIFCKNTDQYYLKINITSLNYYYFLYNFICYIFPILKEIKVLKLQNINKFIIENFNILINPKYNFFENLNLYINLNLNLVLNDSLIEYRYIQSYFSSFNLIF